MRSEVEVAIVGAGAAGIAAARRLRDSGVEALMIEARTRLGGRAWTLEDPVGGPLDLGCGWLHSGDVNPWTAIAEAQGRAVDRTPPPWRRRTIEAGFSQEDQDAFQQANAAFHERIARAGAGPGDPAAADLLEPGGRWNGLIGAIMSYVAGGDLDRLSVRDLAAYADTGVNWRSTGGYGAVIAAHGAGLPVAFGCAVRRIDHRGRRIRIVTDAGDLACDRAIVTLPSALIADDAVAFDPPLPAKAEAARGLPLGLADKLYLSLEEADAFAVDSRVFGRTDSTRTAAYHFRPQGRPIVEGYFGGGFAAELETGGADAFVEHARDELSGLFGADFARRLKPLAIHRWGADPFARGSYSFALPGEAGARSALAAPIDGRLFFAGEACSRNDFSTAHGAYRTGIAAAEAVLAARSREADHPA